MLEGAKKLRDTDFKLFKPSLKDKQGKEQKS